MYLKISSVSPSCLILNVLNTTPPCTEYMVLNMSREIGVKGGVYIYRIISKIITNIKLYMYVLFLYIGNPCTLSCTLCLFWVLSLSLSELSLSSFSCCFPYHLIFDCDISIVYSIHALMFLYLGGQLDKLCFSARPPSRNELHTDCKLYHVLLLGK